MRKSAPASPEFVTSETVSRRESLGNDSNSAQSPTAAAPSALRRASSAHEGGSEQSTGAQASPPGLRGRKASFVAFADIGGSAIDEGDSGGSGGSRTRSVSPVVLRKNPVASSMIAWLDAMGYPAPCDVQDTLRGMINTVVVDGAKPLDATGIEKLVATMMHTVLPNGGGSGGNNSNETDPVEPIMAKTVSPEPAKPIADLPDIVPDDEAADDDDDHEPPVMTPDPPGAGRRDTIPTPVQGSLPQSTPSADNPEVLGRRPSNEATATSSSSLPPKPPRAGTDSLETTHRGTSSETEGTSRSPVSAEFALQTLLTILAREQFCERPSPESGLPHDFGRRRSSHRGSVTFKSARSSMSSSVNVPRPRPATAEPSPTSSPRATPRERSGTLPSPAYDILSPTSGGNRDGVPPRLDLDIAAMPRVIQRRMSLRLAGAIQTARRASLAANGISGNPTPEGGSPGDTSLLSPSPGLRSSASPVPVTPRETRLTSKAVIEHDDTNPHDDTWTINQYVVLEHIGGGRQGEVYEAFDTNLNAMRAIKSVERPPRFAGAPNLVQLGGVSRAASSSPSRGNRRQSAALGDSFNSALTSAVTSRAVSPRPLDQPGSKRTSMRKRPPPTTSSDDTTTGAAAAPPELFVQQPTMGDGPLDCSPRAAGAAISIARLRAKHSQFSRELRITELCQHANTMRLYEVINDEEDECVYLVMELFRKGPIAAIMGDGALSSPFEAKTVARCGLHIARALAHIHSLGVVHRDVKPDNIFEGDDGCFVLGDFGMAEEVQQPHQITDLIDVNDITSPERSQPTRGTVTFLSPELLRASTPTNEGGGASSFAGASPAVDIWALGVTLFLLLEGRLPWSLAASAGARGMADVVDQILTAPITFTGSSGVSSDRTTVRSKVERVVRGMLERDIKRRWPAERARREFQLVVEEIDATEQSPRIGGEASDDSPSSK